ncbi:hypothetical protein E2C01_064910 [Portunus trituberculatus]|uniref:Uncharacterized protein n=1 Tax=Portunus trituberculatus TaxID=210409 RepID=A0A5B7HM41_PORTR|nr:hypothetical protein [Portunus trituberculatus]
MYTPEEGVTHFGESFNLRDVEIFNFYLSCRMRRGSPACAVICTLQETLACTRKFNALRTYRRKFRSFKCLQSYTPLKKQDTRRFTSKMQAHHTSPSAWRINSLMIVAATSN